MYAGKETFMNITYKLDQTVRLIQSPVLLRTGETETSYENGKAVAAASFEKRYAIDSITAENNRIVICVTENTDKGTTDWTDREVSLFDGCRIP